MVTPHNNTTEPNDSSLIEPSRDLHATEVSKSSSLVDDRRYTQTRIRIRIPKTYHQEPVISRLVSDHGVTVNIAAALLGANARDDGWFDLDLSGTGPQIDSALLYLNELDLEIWQEETAQQTDGW